MTTVNPRQTLCGQLMLYRWGSPSPSELMSHHDQPDLVGGHGAIVFNVFFAGFWSCFGLISVYSPIPSFYNGNFYRVPLYVKMFNFIFIFIGTHSQQFFLSLRRDFGIELFSNIRTVKTLVNLRDGLNVFCIMR